MRQRRRRRARSQWSRSWLSLAFEGFSGDVLAVQLCEGAVWPGPRRAMLLRARTEIMLADFLQNLALGHLVRGFNLIDSKIEPVSFQPVLELTFRLTRSKQQNGAGWLEAGKDFVVVTDKASRVLPFRRIIGQHHLRLKRTHHQRTARTVNVLYRAGFYSGHILLVS